MDTFCYCSDYIFRPLGKKWDNLTKQELLEKERHYRPTITDLSQYADPKLSYREIYWSFPNKTIRTPFSENKKQLKLFLISNGIILNTLQEGNQYYQYSNNLVCRHAYKYLCIFQRIVELGLLDQRINASSHDKGLEDSDTIQHHLSLERLRLNLEEDAPLRLKPLDVYIHLLPSHVHNLKDGGDVSIYNRFVKPESIQVGASPIRKLIKELSPLALELGLSLFAIFDVGVSMTSCFAFLSYFNREYNGKPTDSLGICLFFLSYNILTYLIYIYTNLGTHVNRVRLDPTKDDIPPLADAIMMFKKWSIFSISLSLLAHFATPYS